MSTKADQLMELLRADPNNETDQGIIVLLNNLKNDDKLYDAIFKVKHELNPEEKEKFIQNTYRFQEDPTLIKNRLSCKYNPCTRANIMHKMSHTFTHPATFIAEAIGTSKAVSASNRHHHPYSRPTTKKGGGKMGRTSSTQSKTPYTMPTIKKDSSHYLYRDLFYGAEGNPTCRWMRSTANEKGLTRSCYIAQRLFMIRYVLQTYFEYNYHDHSLFENKIFELTNMVQSNTQTQLFKEQNGEKLLTYLNKNISEDCIARLKLLTQLTSGNFNIDNGNVDKLKDTTPAYINRLFEESEHYPIPLAFGLDEPRRGSIMYDIDHWFVLYKKKLCGAAGLFPVEISYFESETLDPAAFHMFLQTMRKENHKVPFDYFKMFMKATMVPESNAIQTYEQEPIPGKDEDETRSTSTEIPIGPAIEQFLASYESRIKKYNIFRLNGLLHGESYATNLFEAIKCIWPLDFIDVLHKPYIKDSTGGNKKKTVRRKHRNKRSYHKRKTYKQKHRKSMKKRKTIKRK